MIDLQKFIEIIKIYKDYDEELDKFEKIIPTFWECKINNLFWKAHTEILKSYFNKEGVTLITDWLCNACNFYNEKEELIETPEDLWNIIKIYRL